MAEQPQAPLSDNDFGERMADLLTGLVRGLVDQPDAISVEIDEEDGTTALSLYVASDDLGKVIGKQGRTARALRTILNAIGSKSQQRISLDVLEDDDEEETEDEIAS